MTRFLLDSTTIILASRRIRVELDWMASAMADGEDLGYCPIVLTEAFRGAHPRERDALTGLLPPLKFWPIEADDAIRAGVMRYDLARQGFQGHLPDALIAAVAARMGAIVVTRNRKDFERVGAGVLDLTVR
jgi:predicted nucleic acid-binding protein